MNEINTGEETNALKENNHDSIGNNNYFDGSMKQTDDKQDHIKRVEFQSFDSENSIKNQADNLELLLDIPLNITVELGRTKKYLKDILQLNVGSIVALEKPAGDLIDVLVNGKLIAKGEVVVIDDYFGVRITDIVTSGLRLSYAKKTMTAGEK